MNRINDRVVYLNNEEVHASGYVDRLLDRGRSLSEAVEAARVLFPNLSDDFFHYLGS